MSAVQRLGHPPGVQLRTAGERTAGSDKINSETVVAAVVYAHPFAKSAKEWATQGSSKGRATRLSLLGYCLMSNHVHLIAVPQTETALSLSLKQAHGRYAAYWNGQQSSTGHVWQGRFYSCPLDEKHLWEALRYVELNPVRDRMVEKPEHWAWSSAAAHCGVDGADADLEMQRWRKRWSVSEWQSFLAEAESPVALDRLRQFTHTGRPLGTAEFVTELEASMFRPLAARKRGRPKAVAPEGRQLRLISVA